VYPYSDTGEVERRLREHLSASERFLLTRTALVCVRTDFQDPLREAREDALMEVADRLGFGDLGSQLMSWAEKEQRRR